MENEIKYRIYEGGRVQSLGFFLAGHDWTSGVCQPGTYHFHNTRTETIIIVAGVAEINGARYEASGPGGERKICIVEPGAGVDLHAITVIAYLCMYD